MHQKPLFPFSHPGLCFHGTKKAPGTEVRVQYNLSLYIVMGIRIPKMFLIFEKIFYCKKSDAVFIYGKSALVGVVIIITKLVSGHNVHLLELPDVEFPSSQNMDTENKSGSWSKRPTTKINAIHFLPLIVMGIRISKMFLIYETFLFLYFL